MVATDYLKVKNNLIVDTKNGGKVRVINIIDKNGTTKPIWINDISQYKDIQAGETIRCIRGINDKLSIIEDKPLHNVNGNGLKPISEVLPNVLDELNLPILSNENKKELSIYIKQQIELFHFINKEVATKFPDLKSNDHRAIAMSIFIDSQRKISG